MAFTKRIALSPAKWRALPKTLIQERTFDVTFDGANSVSQIPPAVNQVLQARNDALRQEVNVAVLRKNLDAQQQAGDAANALIEQAVVAQKQIAEGRLDVQV